MSPNAPQRTTSGRASLARGSGAALPFAIVPLFAIDQGLKDGAALTFATFMRTLRQAP
jgi:hypothetical protein